MKKICSITVIASLIFFSCNQPEENPNDPLRSVTKEKLDNYDNVLADGSGDMDPKLVGKWQVDSSGFIDNGVRKPLEAPLADAFWEFTSDGKLIVSGNASFSSDVHVVDNKFKVKMGGIEMDYRIDKLTDNSLVLMSTIVDTKDLKMESIAKLKKVSK